MKDEETRDRYLVDEMLRHLEVLAEVVRGGKPALASNAVTRYAAAHAIELVAEAAEKVSRSFKNANPSVPWNELRPLRREVAHPYDVGAESVNVDQLWRFATADAVRISRRLRDATFRA